MPNVMKKKRIANQEQLTTVDHFVASFKGDAVARDTYLEDKALQRKREADEIERRRRAKKPSL